MIKIDLVSESVTQLLDATSCCAYFHYVQNPRVLCSPDRLVLGLRLAAHLANQNWAAIQHLTGEGPTAAVITVKPLI